MPLTTDPAFIGHQFYIELDEVQVYVAALACHSSFRNFPKDTPAEEEEEKDYSDTIMDEQFNPKIGDQWKHYTEKDGRTMGRSDNVFHFWRDNGKHLPAVQQMAYDLLAILAMSSEVKRVFSGAKNTLDDKRTKLACSLRSNRAREALDEAGRLGTTSDGKEVRPGALWSQVGMPENLDSDVEPE